MLLHAGSVPAALLLGGGLAIYLGFDELKDNWKSKEQDTSFKEEEVSRYKKEVDDLKKEVETLKKESEKE